MFFSLSSWALALILFAVVVGTTVLGLVAGHQMRKRGDALREPFGVLQTATLGIVALLLAFGLSLAIGRYEARRAAVVAEANAIGTTYLRAQTLAEPVRTPVARSAADVHRPGDSELARGAGQCRDSQDDRGPGGGPAPALEPRRAGAPRRPGGERPAPLRGQPQHDDRPADGPHLGAQQPCPGHGPAAGGGRGGGRARAARALPLPPEPRARGACCSPPCSWRCCSS